MPHIDPTRMVELALGHDASHNDVSAWQHIGVCERCQEELRLTTWVITAARSVQEPDLLACPPERVWQHIAQELAEPREATPPSPAASRCGPPAVSADARHRRSPGARSRRTPLACGLLASLLIVWWRRRKRSFRPSESASDHPPV
ncbi:hypothetical protein [Streptomyces phaeoluteigriseus]|uniref:hypothetical protein n=1 Tax=Streptomyces phaeoluteigriseus TaxID=114686 RepID=UPI0036B02902